MVTVILCPGVRFVTVQEKNPNGNVTLAGLPAVGRAASETAARLPNNPTLVENVTAPTPVADMTGTAVTVTLVVAVTVRPAWESRTKGSLPSRTH